MHYTLPRVSYQFFAFELKNLHSSSSDGDIIAIISQMCKLVGFQRDLYDLGKAVIVVASLGDAIGLLEATVVICSRLVQLTPYFYLGRESPIRYEVEGCENRKAVYF